MESNDNHIGLDPEDWKIFKEIIDSIPFPVYVFGSRVKGTFKKFSDIDLCVLEKLDDLSLFELKEKFSDSDLPMKVDVTRWDDMSEDFRSLIKSDLVLLKK